MEKIKITLTAKQHHYIISFIPRSDRSIPNRLNYILQVKRSLEAPFNEAQEITVEIEENLVPVFYRLMANQPGLYTEDYNPAIRQRLLEQLYENEKLMQALQAIAQEHTAQTESHIKINGINYVASIEL